MYVSSIVSVVCVVMLICGFILIQTMYRRTGPRRGFSAPPRVHTLATPITTPTSDLIYRTDSALKIKAPIVNVKLWYGVPLFIVYIVDFVVSGHLGC